MKTAFHHLHHTDALALLARRPVSRAQLLVFITLALLILTAAPRVKGQNFSFGPSLALIHNNTMTTLTNDGNSGGLGSFAAFAFAPPPETIKGHSGPASPGDTPDSATPGTLYGTASAGGESGYGTVFSLTTDGTTYTVLHDFTGGSDGNGPFAALVLSSNTLYGTTVNGGNYDEGVVFAVDTGGTNFTVLHHFAPRYYYPYTNSGGGNPYCQLVLSSNLLYGTTSVGGSGNAGTVFALNLANTNFTVLHNFAATQEDANYNLTNWDGANPYCRLLLLGNTLYGTTTSGGLGGAGTVFALNLANTNFTVLHNFAEPNFLTLTNTDGTTPYGGLILSGNTLYGMAFRGGNLNGGTVFAVNTNGTFFTNLYSFTGGSDGSLPRGELILFSNVLIGTASSGGDTSLNNGGNGTVFGLNTNGTDFTVLHTFTAGGYDYDLQGPLFVTNSEGANPGAGLIAVNNTLYGTTHDGGSGGNGTVYSLTFAPPPLTILSVTLAGTNLVINGTNAQPGETCVTLMSPNLTLPLSQWTPVATNPLAVTGSFTFTVTNVVDVTAPQRFFILQNQ